MKTIIIDYILKRSQHFISMKVFQKQNTQKINAILIQANINYLL